MKDNQHLIYLGQLWENLHGLEFALRVFIATRNADSEPLVNLESASEGDWVKVNSLTNYDSLGELIKKFNTAVQDLHPKAQIDESVVAVRDALAHGRIAGETASFPMTLIKFGNPKTQKVQVVTKAVMDYAWFKANVNLVHEQIDKVISVSSSLGMKIMEIV